MIEVRLEPDQKVRSLLCSTVAFLSLRGEERLIRISRKGGRVQRERRACHDEFGEGLLIEMRGDYLRMGGGGALRTFNSFELVSMHSFMHVSRKST
jgi:hypothetical protein